MRGWRPSRPNSGLNEQRLSHFCDRDSLAHFPLIVNKIAVFWKEFLLCPPLCAVKTVEFDMRCGSMRFWREHFLSVPARRTMLLYDSPRFRVLSTALRVPRGSLPVRLQFRPFAVPYCHTRTGPDSIYGELGIFPSHRGLPPP